MNLDFKITFRIIVISLLILISNINCTHMIFSSDIPPKVISPQKIDSLQQESEVGILLTQLKWNNAFVYKLESKELLVVPPVWNVNYSLLFDKKYSVSDLEELREFPAPELDNSPFGSHRNYFRNFISHEESIFKAFLTKYKIRKELLETEFSEQNVISKLQQLDSLISSSIKEDDPIDFIGLGIVLARISPWQHYSWRISKYYNGLNPLFIPMMINREGGKECNIWEVVEKYFDSKGSDFDLAFIASSKYSIMNNIY